MESNALEDCVSFTQCFYQASSKYQRHLYWHGKRRRLQFTNVLTLAFAVYPSWIWTWDMNCKAVFYRQGGGFGFWYVVADLSQKMHGTKRTGKTCSVDWTSVSYWTSRTAFKEKFTASYSVIAYLVQSIGQLHSKFLNFLFFNVCIKVCYKYKTEVKKKFHTWCQNLRCQCPAKCIQLKKKVDSRGIVTVGWR